MKRTKQTTLATRGWTVGTVADFLALTPEEAAFVEIKLALSDALRAQRQKARLSQAQVASKLATARLPQAAYCPTVAPIEPPKYVTIHKS